MKRVAVLAALVLALAAVVGFMHRHARDLAENNVAAHEGAISAAHDKAVEAVAPAPVPTTAGRPENPNAPGEPTASSPGADSLSKSLPPLDEPFARHMDELRRRARDGDARAACRLGMELAYCSGLRDLRRVNDAEAARVASGSVQARPSTIMLRDSLARMEAQCLDVVATDALEAFRNQLVAARAGIVQAQLQLATFPPLDSVDPIDQVDVWREWRSAALPALESALAAGDTRAPHALSRAYAEEFGSPWTPRLVRPDPYLSYVYARLNTLLIERASDSRSDLVGWVANEGGHSLSQVDRERAALEAQRLFDASYSRLPANRLEPGSLNGNDFAACER